MSKEYYSIKWLNDCSAKRKTKEVEIFARFSFKDFSWRITITGKGDCQHHLLEDTRILVSKMCEKFCGHK